MFAPGRGLPVQYTETIQTHSLSSSIALVHLIPAFFVQQVGAVSCTFSANNIHLPSIADTNFPPCALPVPADIGLGSRLS